MARATRRHAENFPRLGTSLSMRSGSELGPSTSFSITGTQLSEVTVQLELHAGSSIEMFAGRMSGFLSPFPEAVDHRRHEAQHAAGPLELHERRPVVVEPVEDLGVDRKSRLDALLVVRVAALGRELLVLSPVQVREGPRHHVAVFELPGSASGSKSRRRTISNPSLALAGPHDDSILPTTFRFAALEATFDAGKVRTKRLLFQGRRLHVNANVRFGVLAVDLLNQAGRSVETATIRGQDAVDLPVLLSMVSLRAGKSIWRR